MSFYLFGHKYTLGVQDSNKKNKQFIRKMNTQFLRSDTVKSHIARPNSGDLFNCSRNIPELYKCYYCDFRTEFLVEFNKHVAEPSNKFCSKVSLYVCDSCNFETFSRLVLLKHAYMKCAASTPNSLLILAATKASLLDCYKRIRLLYNQPTSLKQDMKATCGSKQKQSKCRKILMCEHCSYQTPYWGSFKQHKIRKHTAEEDIEWLHCKHCSFKAKFKSILDRHLFKEHTAPEKVVWLQCNECMYRTIWRAQFVKHYNTVHGTNKMYECDKCPHKTRYSSHFKRHCKEQHSDDFKWLQCEHCPYRAKQRIHMKLHMVQRHTAIEDIEWYECKQCSYRAKIKASLKNHVLKKHATSEQIHWFICEKCGYKVKEKGLLKKHLQKKHV